jgi:hypothetical protein
MENLGVAKAGVQCDIREGNLIFFTQIQEGAEFLP